MKKLSGLLIAISFCILSAGNALANDFQMDAWDRHAVWSGWFDEKGNRLPDTVKSMTSDPDTTQRVSTETAKGRSMDEKDKRFEFIRETKSYDYAKDKGPSA